MDREEYEIMLQLINKELEYMSAFDLTDDERLLPAAGALMVLRQYVQQEIKDMDPTN